MRKAEDILRPYETYVKHSNVPIYLQETVLEAIRTAQREAVEECAQYILNNQPRYFEMDRSDGSGHYTKISKEILKLKEQI